MWTPATKEEVEAALLAERNGIGASTLGLIDRYKVEPYLVALERFGKEGQAYVVARSSTHVVFFEDVEEVFGIAREEGGRLLDCAMYGGLALAIGELHRFHA